jgi:phage terminase small subunit
MFEPDDGQEDGGSVSGPSALSQVERVFCDMFVGNGGNAKEAAIAAGVDPGKAAVQACRWLCKRRVADHIHRLCQRLVHASLPIAIKALMDIAADETAQRKDRIKAATSLLEHGGMAAPKGGVSVSVGVAVNGQQAQQLISSVWEARAARLSDIPTAMPDTLQSDLRDIEQLAISPPQTPPGGVELQGPAAGTCPLPAPSTAKPQKSAVSCECPLCREREAPAEDVDDGDAAAEFRRAFGDDD